MGRRHLLIWAITLLALSTAPRAWAQDDEGKPLFPESVPLPDAPAPFPPGVTPSADRSDADDVPAPPRKVNLDGLSKDQPKKNTSPTQSKPGPSDVERREGPAKPPTDEKVTQAQATAPSTDAGPAATPVNTADVRVPTVDRLPLGQQSVAVTVDVQAPATMNLTKQATLKLIVKNTGVGDAFNVRIDDELPDGLEFVSSVPEMQLSNGHHLSWSLNFLQAGSNRVITMIVKPNKIGPFDHIATVRFETGCKTRTTVLQPRLKVDIIANPTVGKVLRGQQVEFQVSVQNTGDGPARNVAIRAKLSPGLKHESSPKGDEPMVYELTLRELPAGATEKLDPLVADATLGGDQFCSVTASSDDVVPSKEESENVKKIEVVEPKLKLALEGPEQRYTDTVADYKVVVENPGTAPSRKVRVLVTLPISGKLIKYPPEARFEKNSSKLYWTIDQIDPGPKTMALPFQVRMGGIGSYEVLADAIGEGGLKVHERKTTDVVGIADVDLVVSESKRVVDVGGQTTFQIRLRNYGTKEATHLLVKATLSPNLKLKRAGSVPEGVSIEEKDNEVKFQRIDKLGPGKEMILGMLVTVTGPDPKLATCKVSVIHDDLPDNEKFEDMAGVKVTSQRRVAVTPANP